MTENEWWDTYRPLPNIFDLDASMNGCLYETYGAEVAAVLAVDRHRVWTWVDGDDGEPLIVPGYHLVNRIGYLVAAVPRTTPAEEELCIALDDGPIVEPEWIGGADA